MKEIDKKDLPEVGGGIFHDEGCIPPPDPLKDPNDPLLLTTDQRSPDV